MPAEKKRSALDANPALRLASMGAELFAAIAGMLLFGYLADHLLGTLPWLSITGVTVGAIGGLYNFIRNAARETRRTNEQFRREHPAGLGRSREHTDTKAPPDA